MDLSTFVREWRHFKSYPVTGSHEAREQYVNMSTTITTTKYNKAAMQEHILRASLPIVLMAGIPQIFSGCATLFYALLAGAFLEPLVVNGLQLCGSTTFIAWYVSSCVVGVYILGLNSAVLQLMTKQANRERPGLPNGVIIGKPYFYGLLFNNEAKEQERERRGKLDAEAGLIGRFIDPRDGRPYRWVKIDNQIWLAENLAYRPSTGRYWAYANQPDFVAGYGYLYDWETAQRVCPPGWHLPSPQEYRTLLIAVGGTTNRMFVNHYKRLRRRGFSPLLGGYRHDDGKFYSFGAGGSLWSDTSSNYTFNRSRPGAYAWYLEVDESQAFLSETEPKERGLAVRCIKD